MERKNQRFEEVVATLSSVDTAWIDEHAEDVIALLAALPTKSSYSLQDVDELFAKDFDAGLTATRLFLDLSKDEFTGALREQLGGAGIGITAYRKDADRFLRGLDALGLRRAIADVVNRPPTWSDVLVERLKSGRGSAIKGQKRGRILEDFTEALVRSVFGDGGYDVRCRFIGESGVSTEKADFAIPSKSDPQILLESKAYGATGSKQTDIIGDVTRIVNEKRQDTTFLLVLDGVTWKDRANDLRKLIDLQNRGRIARIYTVKMAEDLERDLRQLKTEYGL